MTDCKPTMNRLEQPSRISGWLRELLVLGCWLMVVIPGAVSAQDLQVELVSSVPGAVGIVDVQGRYACLANERTLTIVDVSEPSNPRREGSFTLPDPIWGVRVFDGLVYVADGLSGLYILDISDPSTLRLVGSYQTGGQTVAVVLSRSRVLTVSNMAGLQIIDVSDPATPTLLGSHLTPGFARDLAASGSLAYVADQPSGLHIIDVSDPTAPAALGLYSPAAGTVQRVVVSPPNGSGSREAAVAYLLDARRRVLQIFDVSDPSAPVQVGAYEPAGRIQTITTRGVLAYLGVAGTGLEIIDVSDPSAPVLLGSHDTGSVVRSIAVSESLVLVAKGNDGLAILRHARP